jgi:hypothetical protein
MVCNECASLYGGFCRGCNPPGHLLGICIVRFAIVIFLFPFGRGSIGGLDGAGLTGERLRLALDPATALQNFHPLPAHAAIPRETRKCLRAALHAVPALWVRSDRPRPLRLPSRPQWSGPKRQKGI